MKYKKIAITCTSNNEDARQEKFNLIKKHNFLNLDDHKNDEDLDLIIVLGGDGTMLHLLHKYEKKPIAFYGINYGNVGFLMNKMDEENLITAIKGAKESIIHPLIMNVENHEGKKYQNIAINEVSLLRQASQASKIKVKINNKDRIDCLLGDGVLLASPAGSTAYNMSCRGPIIPLSSEILALTPISPFRPRNWHGAILPSNCEVEFEILEHKTRPVSATADFIEVKNVTKVSVKQDKNIAFKILFDANNSLEERIIQEQFRG